MKYVGLDVSLEETITFLTKLAGASGAVSV
jgi:hypothetical protein